MPDQHPDWLKVKRALTYPKYQIIEYAVHRHGDPCFNFGVNAYFKVLDKDGKYVEGVTVYWDTTGGDHAEDKTRPEGSLGYCYYPSGKEIPWGIAFAMTEHSSFNPARGESGPYYSKVAVPGIASDVIEGMGLPLREHVQFTTIWQYVSSINDGSPPEPPNSDQQYTPWAIAKQTELKIVLRRKKLTEK